MNPAIDPSPDSFGPYEVFERLGMGGMAMVHRAKKQGIEGFERSVALKRMLAHLAQDTSFVDSFIREAKVASLLHHPNIAQVYDFGRISGVYYIAMELVSGFDVRKLLRYASKSGESIPMPVLLSVLGELADALEYAHGFADEQGNPLRIVHRDISPSNLIIAQTGHLKVIDFGIAKANTQQLHTESGQVKGKLGYMSPEAALGMPLDPVSDIFSMGVVAWELVTASPLFSARTDYETMRRIREADIVPPSHHNPMCPPELDSIIVSALDRDAERRMPSAGVFRAALDALATQHGIHASARHVAEWLARFAQPGDGWNRPSVPSSSKQALPLPPERPTAVQRKRSPSASPSARLQRSNEQKQLATEIWGEDMPVMTQSPSGPDFSVQVSRPSTQPPPLTNTLPPLIPQPQPLLNVPMYTPTQHPAPVKSNRNAFLVVGALAVVAGVLAAVLVLESSKSDPPLKAQVRFVIAPTDAHVIVAGEPLRGDSIALAEGNYAVSVDHAGYKPWTRDITVHAGESQTINVSLEHEAEAVAVATPQPTRNTEEIDVTPAPTRKPVKKPVVEKKPTKPEVVVAEEKPEPPPPEPKPEVKPPPPVEPPPVKPEKPARTPAVSASAVTKVSGEIPKLKSSGGESNGDALAKMCIDESGKVTSVKIVKSTAAIASELQSALQTWRYKPYLNKDKQAQPVCFPLSLRLVFKRAD